MSLNPNEIYECKLCGTKIRIGKKWVGVRNHLEKHHKLTKEEYTQYWIDHPYKKIYPEPIGEYGVDYVLCPICNDNRQYQSLTQHIINKHKMTTEEFLRNYPNSILFTSKYSEMRSKFCRKGAIKNWSDPEYRKYKSESVKLQHKNGLIESIIKGHRSGWFKYKLKDDTEVVIKSSWEFKLLKFLEDNNIEFRYEIPFKYYDSYRKKDRTYYADFLLLEYNLVIEVKPEYAITDQVVLDKMNAVINSGYNFIFFTEREMGSLVSIDKFSKLIQSKINA